MKNAQKAIIFVVFLIGIALLGYAIFYPVPPEDEVMEELAASAPANGVEAPPVTIEELPTTAWRTSKGQLTVDVPEGWNVTQRDAGSVSEITVTNPDAPDESLAIRLALSYVFGQFTDFDSWMNEELVDADSLNVCEDKIVDDKQTSCVVEVNGEDVTENYFGSANTSLYFRIERPLDGSMSAYFDQIISSLNFEPTKADLAAAKIIQ